MKISRRTFVGLSAGGALATMGYSIYSNVSEVVRVAMPLAGLRSTLRVLFLSDLHLPRCFVMDDTLRDSVKDFRPHLILIGGDSVDRAGNEPLVDWFGEIDAELGKFAVLGNWEYKGRCNRQSLRRHYADAGVQLLVNETAVLPRPERAAIRIVGLDDLLEGRPRPQLAAMPTTDAATATIVLAHCPALFDHLPRAALLCLSGHTHGGQIAPFGFVFCRLGGWGRYLHGAYSGGDGRRLYVSRGLGNNGVPFRIGPRPEIVQLTLSPAST